jgi:protein-S-isoprenylcysteine O-methyltransferase Ste14
MAETKIPLSDQRPRFRQVRLAAVPLLALFLVSGSAWQGLPFLRAMIEALGVLMIVAAVLIRLWATLYIGGRKNATVVRDGPYSICRHPLYLGSVVGAFGLGLMFGSLVLSVLAGLVALAILSATAAREERVLAASFGADWVDYAARVPRLVPALRLFRTPPEVTFRPVGLRRGLLDSGAFLSAILLVPVFQLARDLGPGVLLSLP